jgi:hypothetical protein
MAREKPPKAPVDPLGWLYLRDGARDLSVSEEDLQKVTRHLPQGSLVPVMKTKEKRGETYGRVASLNLETGLPELGWVKMDLAEMKPLATYPPDTDLVPLLGDPYLDDVTAKHTFLARYAVRQAQGPDLLLCYVLTAQLSMAKLVVFTPTQGKYSPGASLNVPITELQTGITSLEVRDLLGDGSDCIISKETFRDLEQTYGTNLMIRRIVDGQFQIVWQAPLKYQNFSQYFAKLNILQPPEKNFGAPGTVTTGAVTFRPNGKGQEPVWSGKVEFFIVNREKALDTVKLEKACPWDGKEFTPLR